MGVKPLSLVKYAGEYWFTLADYTITRDTEGYSDHASVKSAIRTFVVKTNPDKYIAFRGEVQIRNIVQENRNNPLFQSEDFQGTRTALIHWDMLDALNNRFKVAEEYKEAFPEFVKKAEEFMNSEDEKQPALTDESLTDSVTETRSILTRQLRQELHKLDRSLDILQRNREKILQALNAIEGLEIDNVQ